MGTWQTVEARTNNYIKTFRDYENLLLRRAVFQQYCANQESLAVLKEKINQLIKNKEYDTYSYLVESDENFRLKAEQIKQDFINNIGYHALGGRFQGVDNLQKYMEKAPNGAFMGDLLKSAYERLSFDAKSADSETSARITPTLNTLQKLLEHCGKLVTRQVPQTMVQKVLEWPFDKFWPWYEGGMKVGVSDQNQIGPAFQSSKLDLNRASLQQIKALPGFSEDMAKEVHGFIAARKGINSYKELMKPLFTSLSREYEPRDAALRTNAIIESLQLITYISDAALEKRKWTMMIFINADNDLEGAGIGDINEMEQVGSTDQVNIVVQIDRHKDTVKNGANHVYDVSNGNWTGARRYFIEKDNDPNSISSQVKGKLGETDAGTPESLKKFVDWSVNNYPAEHYYLIIWNHGGGLDGISWDDESGSHISAEALMDTVQGAAQLAGKKIDIVNFDACLMALVEIAWQIKGHADIMIASEEVEPGYGLPYTDILAYMVKNPSVDPDTLARHVVKVYTKSYVLGGSQAERRAQSVNYSAIRLDRMDSLNEAINGLADALMNNFGDYVKCLHENVGFKLRTYNNGQHDMIDLVQFLVSKCSNTEIRAAGRKVLKSIGYPVNQRNSLKAFEGPITIVAQKGSTVRWGVNGFDTPTNMDLPADTVLNGGFAETTITQVGEDGRYCMTFNSLPEDVHSIYYRILKPDGQRYGKVNVASRTEYFYTEEFPKASPVLAEAHTAGMEFSYGLAINYCNSDSYKKEYEKLEFTKVSKWDEFLRHTGAFRKTSDILVIPDCANDFRDDLHLKFYADLLKGRKYDVYDFRYYGPMSESVIESYANGTVIVFAGYNNDLGTLTDMFRRPDGTTYAEKRDFYSPEYLVRHIERGGNLILNGHDIEKDATLGPLFDSLGVSIAGELKEQDIVVTGVSADWGTAGISEKILNINNEYHPPYPAILTPMENTQILFTYPDGSCAATVRDNGKGKAVFMGFELESFEGSRSMGKTLRGLMKGMTTSN
jgi:hypothetical protein